MTVQSSLYTDDHFRAWAAESDRLLREIAAGWVPPPPTAAERDRIRRDALRAIARDIPDPAEYAMQLEFVYAEALAQAHRAQDPANAGCLRVSLALTRDCFAIGLTDRDGYLTAFGMAVRREIMADQR